MMRVYYVYQNAVTPAIAGGTRHFELAQAMQQLGVETEVVATDLHLATRTYLRRKSPKDFRAIREVYEGVPFHWIYASPYDSNDTRRGLSMVTAAWNSYRLLRKLPKPDLIIGSSPFPFTAYGAERAAAFHGVPFVLEVRDIYPQTLIDMQGDKGLKVRVLERTIDHLYAKADHAIVLAKGTKEHLLERGVEEHSITYLPNGVSTELFPSMTEVQRRALRQQYGLPQDRKLFIYAGAHGDANGLDTLLEAASLLKSDQRLALVLVGDGAKKPDLKLQAEALRLDNVHFLNPLPKAVMPELLGSMDAGLLILRKVDVFRYGICPNKLFDYWAARLPVIATTPGEVAGLISSAQGGTVVEPETPELLAEAITNFTVDESSSIRLGQNGRAFVEREFERTQLAKRLADTLHTVVQQAIYGSLRESQPTLSQVSDIKGSSN
ncbi:MAG: glycosyltransferase family 4 protein [Trueperaceae bacterium]|nr:MAG: glycosyltransferase family 4 protein [Trueperaceae bacterium]